ncbi:hypothetical protein [Pseudomonas sp. MF6747]|uniref:hypothetical protein n=1 Tax=Pseudomonas sp. MF6747 TaxID=2797527 RepID=UPI001909659F|nr:hypothetical protein [Pseudomonas sp. MF6747]MBK3506629.1 hypothetical protein [Pseudomonas sp. MF6747]
MKNKIKNKRTIIDNKLIAENEKSPVESGEKESALEAFCLAIAFICIAFTATILHMLNSSPLSMKEIGDKLTAIRYGYSEQIKPDEYERFDVFYSIENCRINNVCKTQLIERIFNQEPNAVLSTLKEYEVPELSEKDIKYAEKYNKIENIVRGIIQDKNHTAKITAIVLRYDFIKERYKTEIRDSFYENLTVGDYDAGQKLKQLKTYEIFNAIIKDEFGGLDVGGRLIRAMNQSKNIVDATEQ